MFLIKCAYLELEKVLFFISFTDQQLALIDRMATQEIAAMLDELMGRNRNSVPDDKIELEI